ncbi:hypothetical protein [Leifsonia sp. C5G2]|uniref:hypothetical protein n=1 Tax=Leifsonia sp. C5G2 TaxID=2735269 RepID=UPI0015851A17|nr:hypothetical protein [Leifsonia sp. C5G2]NUU06421.1 hypothetical protein [Leifsonia sp. C5G2]
MTTFAELTSVAEYHSDFHVQTFDGENLLIVGSFDLSYYHYIEIRFFDVQSVNCATWFHTPIFREPTSSGRFAFQADGCEFEIVAARAQITLGMVYHYDRGTQLLPGERIAPWVKLSDT